MRIVLGMAGALVEGESGRRLPYIVMLNPFQHPWRVLATHAAQNLEVRPWTLKQVQGDDNQ